MTIPRAVRYVCQAAVSVLLAALVFTSCSYLKYVYDLVSFVPSSPALSKANPTVEHRPPTMNEISISWMWPHFKGRDTLVVDTADVNVQCLPAGRSASPEDDFDCIVLIQNKSNEEIAVIEPSIRLLHDVCLAEGASASPQS